ncbi:PREDICTED: uncharacterized protein LOC109468291 [Branchiostoma belcheri]|uniref:Uncharacterized protein LOC109468291 n=1 Tax=Branchiostoma belcheri TaxID=7741 RepID=A0A6P4XZP6_BRABE|nr:PREDICTED: uncharacterized protein LOC109468291 [Branchiostoma belcheri]
MSGAPAVVMVWDIGKWWFRKEDGKVALVNNGEDLGTVEDILEGNTFGSLKIILELGPPTKLAVRNFDPEANDFCGQFKEAGRSGSRRAFLECWETAKVNPGSVPVEKPTAEGSSVTEATTTAPEEADSDVVKRHFVGNFEIPVDRMVSPHWRRLCRQPEPSHVEDLRVKFKATPDMSFTVLAVHLPGITPEAFQPNEIATYEYEVLGGNHTRLALQKLRQEQPDNTSFQTRMAKVYCGLPDSLAKRVGIVHNDANFYLPAVLKDRLYTFRAAVYAEAGFTDEASLTTVEPPRNKATEGRWKDGLCTMLGIVDTQNTSKRKILSNQHGVEVRLAMSSCRVWAAVTQFIARWEEGRIRKQPRSAGRRHEIKGHHLRFLNKRETDDEKVDVLEKLMSGELEYKFDLKKVQDKDAGGSAEASTTKQRSSRAEKDTPGKDDSICAPKTAGGSEATQPDKQKDDTIAQLRAEVKRLEKELQCLKETHKKTEGDLLKKLEEEKASCKNLQYEKAQMEEEQKRLLWDLGNLREKSNEGSQISDENEQATSKGLGQKRHVSGEGGDADQAVRAKSRRTAVNKDPLYKVGDFVVIAGEANDGKDRVPWFARVITTDPAKQRLTLRWYVPNKEGVYEREVLDGKPLKDESIRYAEILTSVQLTDRMTLPEEEMSKAWKAL